MYDYIWAISELLKNILFKLINFKKVLNPNFRPFSFELRKIRFFK